MAEAIEMGPPAAAHSSELMASARKAAELAEEINAQQDRAVAQIVQRQAELSSNRAETLARQAEQMETRIEVRETQEGLGSRLDIRV